MAMVRRGVLGAGALAMSAATVTAQAADVNDFIRNGANAGSDENREYLIDNVATIPGQIDIGDSIRGMVSINTINDVSANIGGATGNDELTGVFQQIVTNKVNLGGGIVQFTFGPDPAFEAVHGAGAIIALYTDPSNNVAGDFTDAGAPSAGPDDGTAARTVPPSSADVSSGLYVTEEAFIATATDGALWAVLGFAGLAGEGFSGLSTGGDNILTAFTFTSGTSFVSNNLGLNLLSIGAGWDPNISINRTTPSPFGGVVDFAVSGETRGVFDLDTAFEASSNLNFSFNATVVPEPTAVVLMGLGLVGVGLASARGRRRREAA
jgi:hypothetical protein